MLKQHTDTLTMMHPPNGLRKDLMNWEYAQFWTHSLMFLLWDRVCANNAIDRRGVDPVYGVAREHTVGNEGVDLCRATFTLEKFRCASDRVGGVGHVIDENGDFASNIAHEHHCCVLPFRNAGWAALLIDG